MKRILLSRVLLWAWILVVMMFMLVPVFSLVLLSFNTSPVEGYPLRGFTLHWYGNLFSDRAVLDAIYNSIRLGLLSGAISTFCGTLAAYSTVRYWQRGRMAMNAVFTSPLIVPHVIIGVGVLLLFGALGWSRSFGLLVCGHVALTLPYVFTTMFARLSRLSPAYEEAARSLGAPQWRVVAQITLPAVLPAIMVSVIFAFAMSFDEVTATMFWKPANFETIQTQILAMQQFSMTPAVNALATTLIGVTLLFPLGRSILRKYSTEGLKK